MSDYKSSNAEAAAVIARVRRMMMIATATTFLAVAVIIGVIGYRVFHLGESAGVPASPPEVTTTVPTGAKVLSSAVGDGHIVLTIEIDGRIELRTFDLHTLKPLGRLKLQPQQ